MKLMMNMDNELKIPASPFRKHLRKSFNAGKKLKKKHKKGLKGNAKPLEDVSKNDN